MHGWFQVCQIRETTRLAPATLMLDSILAWTQTVGRDTARFRDIKSNVRKVQRKGPVQSIRNTIAQQRCTALQYCIVAWEKCLCAFIYLSTIYIFRNPDLILDEDRK